MLVTQPTPTCSYARGTDREARRRAARTQTQGARTPSPAEVAHALSAYLDALLPELSQIFLTQAQGQEKPGVSTPTPPDPLYQPGQKHQLPTTEAFFNPEALHTPFPLHEPHFDPFFFAWRLLFPGGIPWSPNYRLQGLPLGARST